MFLFGIYLIYQKETGLFYRINCLNSHKFRQISYYKIDKQQIYYKLNLRPKEEKRMEKTDNNQNISENCRNEKEILSIKNISKKYQNKEGEVLAIQNVNLTIKQGEFVSIIGPSGCGKSTLLSIIAGLEEKTTGEIYIEGEKITGISPKIGYMLQRDCLLEWRTILSNVMFGLEIKGKKDEASISYVEKLLKKYDLYDFKDKYPSELSGGMRQRVALIRTLAVNPKILLLDEAFSALDYQTRIMVTNDIYHILRKEGITALIVTHDISEAISMSDRIAVLSKRPGTVKAIHKIDFEMEDRNPINCRESPKFSKYFNTLWKELGVDE